MIKINKLLAVLLALSLLLSFLAPVQAAEKKLSVVATIFPIYDWVREITGDSADLTMLLDSGVDLHSFQPTARDILTIATCDVFLYVGGESDAWVEDALRQSAGSGRIVINLLECLGDSVKTEERTEGMEHSHEEDGEEEEADEHIWLSLRNARALVSAIAGKLAEADPAHGEAWRQNAETYGEKLAALDVRYTEAVGQAAFSALLFGDRFPFRYLADDYGLTCYAAFSGCSAETEASFQTIVFLARKVDELGLPAVLTLEGTQHKIAETVIQATAGKNQKLLALDSMQGITAEDVRAGASYLAIMEANLDVLKEALN